MAAYPTTLAAWLDWQLQLHHQRIDMGLPRVRQVADRLGLLRPATRVITVAGTNGKGSSIALMEQMLLAAGYRVASYTSPHLLRYNERLRINAKELEDARWCAAFAAVESARGELTLTFFEYGTLAALWLMQASQLDVALLEVGLGGRLDAVNIVDADVGIITNIGLDHCEWLGDTREAIAREKAGIMRSGRPIICCDHEPPHSLLDAAASAGAALTRIDVDFGVHSQPASTAWQWWASGCSPLTQLPLPALPGAHQLDNAAGAIAALRWLQLPEPIAQSAIAQGLTHLQLPGRLQTLPLPLGGELLLDVAHNREGCAVVRNYLQAQPLAGQIRAVFSALAEKPLAAMIDQLAPMVTQWFYAGLPQQPRGLSDAQLRALLADSPAGSYHATLDTALDAAAAQTQAGDRVLVFGSFFTVGAALEWYAHYTANSQGVLDE